VLADLPIYWALQYFFAPPLFCFLLVLICLISQHKRHWERVVKGDIPYIVHIQWHSVGGLSGPRLLLFIFITATCIAFCLYAFNAITTLFTLIYARTETQNPDQRARLRRGDGAGQKGWGMSEWRRQTEIRQRYTHTHDEYSAFSIFPLSFSTCVTLFMSEPLSSFVLPILAFVLQSFQGLCSVFLSTL